MVELVVLGLFLLPATAACLYHVVPTAVGRSSPFAPRRDILSRSERRLSLTALVPAHDEPAVGRTVRSALAAGCSRVVVVADNCTDDTRAVAATAGATVVVRTDPANRGKGYAVAHGLPVAVADGPDAVLILDADCELVPGSVEAYATTFAAGAEAAQGAVTVRPGDGPAGLVAAVGSVLDSQAAAGRARLGLRVPLRGTGMAFRPSLLARVPWTATGLTEDAEYAAKLRSAGVQVRFAFGAEVRTDAPPGSAALCGQRRRWRAALTPGKLVESKPLVLAHLLMTVIAAGFAGGWAMWWAAAVLVPTAMVYLFAVRRVGWSRQVVAAPLVVGRLLVVTLGGLLRRERTWQRTRRTTDAGVP